MGSSRGHDGQDQGAVRGGEGGAQEEVPAAMGEGGQAREEGRLRRHEGYAKEDDGAID